MMDDFEPTELNRSPEMSEDPRPDDPVVGGSQREKSEKRLSFQRLSEFDSAPLQWIWEGFIPQAKLALLVGEPGSGKSLVALQAAAMVTRGFRVPQPRCSEFVAENETTVQTDIGAIEETAFVKRQRELTKDMSDLLDEEMAVDPEALAGTPGYVAIVHWMDDNVGDTIRPRLEMAGADVERVFVVQMESAHGVISEQTTSVKEDDNLSSEAAKSDAEEIGVLCRLRRLEAGLLEMRNQGIDLQLVVIDSFDHLVSSLNKSQVCEIMDHLVSLPSRLGAAVLVVANCAISRIGRTFSPSKRFRYQDLAAAARSVLMVVQDCDHEHRRWLLPVKLNLSRNRPGMMFSLRDGVMQWLAKPIRQSANEYVRSLNEKKKPLETEETSQLVRAIKFLRETLSEGPLSSSWIQREARDRWISYPTLRRAYCRLECRSYKKKGAACWFWFLPDWELMTQCSPPADIYRGAQKDADEQH